jgi:hypothetical protein
LTNLLPLAVGLAYALLGRPLASLWVGAANVPHSAVPYWVAGGAIFFVGSARLPTIYAYATVHLRQLNIAVGLELLGKFLFAILFFRKLGYMAVPAGTCAAHALGVAIVYRRLAPSERPAPQASPP